MNSYQLHFYLLKIDYAISTCPRYRCGVQSMNVHFLLKTQTDFFLSNCLTQRIVEREIGQVKPSTFLIQCFITFIRCALIPLTAS